MSQHQVENRERGVRGLHRACDLARPGGGPGRKAGAAAVWGLSAVRNDLTKFRSFGRLDGLQLVLVPQTSER